MDLREYQIEGIQKLREAFRGGKQRVVVYSPTGSGKSVMAIEIIKMALARGKRVAFLVNRAGLVHQFSRHLDAAGIGHGILQSVNTHSLDSNVIVGTVQTAARRRLPPVDMTIIDEAHAVPGSKDYLKLIFAFNNIPWIGLTATPFSKGMAKTHPELQNEPLFQGIVVAATIRELIEQGFLVDCDIFAPSEPDLKGIRMSKNTFGEMDYNERELGEAVDKVELIGDIVKNWKKLAGGKKTVVFATNIAHAKHIAQQFRQAGVEAEQINGYMTEDERDQITHRFERGETAVLCNVAVLREGWDFPACAVMVLARPTRSLIAWIQMCGRILRPAEGKTTALIIDHSGTVHRLGFPTDDLPLELCDGNKKSETKAETKELKERKCSQCHFIKKTHTCPKCGFTPVIPNKIKVAEGSLQAVQRVGKADKQRFYSELLCFAKMKGYKVGYAANQYRTKFGVWPRGLHEGHLQPSSLTLGWVQHQLIKFHKERQGAG